MDNPPTSGSHKNPTNVPRRSRVDICFVPMCPSNSTKFPNKIFLTGPNDPKLRKKWFRAAKRDDIFSSKTVIRCCEDHFDLEMDVENWMKFKFIGGRLFLKKDVVPHIFECQNRMMPMKPRSAVLKRKRREILDSIKYTPDPSLDLKSKETLDSQNIKVPLNPHKQLKKTEVEMIQPKTVAILPKQSNLPNDMTNYTRYRVMGSVKKIMMKPGCLPTKFECQESRSDIVSTTSDLDDESQCSTAIQESLKGTELTADKSENNEILFSNSEGRCPMIEIPLSTKQFALPAGFEAVGLSLSSDEDPDNTSLYCEDDIASEQNTQPLGENSMFKGFQCSVCDSEIVGFRYTCVQCSDLDLCGACEAARAHHHHYVLRVPADRLAEETETVLATIRLHLMKDLDPIAELEPDPGKSVKLEIKTESEEEVNITLEQEEFHNVTTPDLIIPDTKIIDESMVLPIEINEIEDPQVPLNISTMESEMASEMEPTDRPTAAKRKICATKMQRNTKKGKKIRAVPSASSGIDTNVLSTESSSAAKFKVLQLPPPLPTTSSEEVQKISISSDLSNNTTRAYSYNTYRVAPDCTVRLSKLPDAVLDVQRTSSQPPSNKSYSAAEDKR